MPGFFGMPLGLAALGALWLYASARFGAPAAVGDLLMLLATATWVGLTVAYLRQGPRRILADARDPALGPFLAAPVMTALLLGAALSSHAPAAARVVVVISLVPGVLLLGWMTARWLTGVVDRKDVGPAFYLPGAGIGWIGSEAASAVRLHAVAVVLFAIGVVAWAFISSIVLSNRLAGRRLPNALMPTLAIELAPPAVAGNTYFLIHSGSPDTLAFGLAAYAAVMLVVQVRRLALYRALSFTRAFWAFTFPSAAMATFALRWLGLERPAGDKVYAWILMAAVTVLVALIGARTVVAAVRATRSMRRPVWPLPRPPARPVPATADARDR